MSFSRLRSLRSYCLPSLRSTVFASTTLIATNSVWGATTLGGLKRLSIEELMEIQVTSVSRSPVALADSPSALQVVTNQQIRRSGATSIPEALRLANNLNVARKGAGNWGISARGFNTELANKLLVMIDGRTIYTPLFSGVRWDVQDYLLEDIDRIEVVSGPGGALWGANAVNGVINITTRDSKDTQGFYGEVGGGNALRQATSLRYGGHLSTNTHFRVYGKYTDRQGEALASGVRLADAVTMRQAGFRLDAERPQGTLTFQGDGYVGHEGIARAGDAKVAGGNALSRWSQVLANGSDLQLQLYYDRTYLRQPFAPGAFGPKGYFTEDLETYDLDFQHSFPLNRANKVVWGLGYRFTSDRTQDAPAVGFRPQDLDHELWSGFIQDQFTIREGTVLTLGTKLEHNDYTGTEVGPNIRLQQDLGPDHMLWSAVSRAVRTPSRVDRDIRQPSRGTTILAGGSEFESETVIAYEAGYRGQLTSQVIGSLSVFYNDYKKIRSLRSTPATFLPLYFANDLEGETYGFEATANYVVSKAWQLQTSYTLLKGDIRVRPGGVDRNNALNENADPENQLAIGSSLDLPKGVEFDLHYRWIDTLIVNNNGLPATVPSYAELNARLAFHLNEKLELSIVGQNLLDDHHPEFGNPGVNRVEIRRSVFAKVAWRY